MSENKKYYWLKLHKDFFKRHDIRIIEAMPNGKDYILFYLKLLVESVSHEGQLRFSDTIPYNEEMLSTITNTNVDIVRAAMGIFQELNMIDILEDSTIYMAEVEKMIGFETDWAKKKREYRKHKEDNVLTMSSQCPANVRQEIEKEIEKEIEIEKDNKVTCQQIADLYNSLCPSLPRCTKLSDKRKRDIRSRLKNYTYEDFMDVFTKAEASEFLKGSNDKKWSATFDWLINDANMAKVLDGNYDNKKATANKGIESQGYDFAAIERAFT